MRLASQITTPPLAASSVSVGKGFPATASGSIVAESSRENLARIMPETPLRLA